MLEAQCLHKLDVPLKKKDGKLDAHLPMGVACIKMIFFFWVDGWVLFVGGWVGVGLVACCVWWIGEVWFPSTQVCKKAAP